MKHAPVVIRALLLSTLAACGGTSSQEGTGSSSSGATSGTPVRNLAEAEPNNGTSAAEVQLLGDFGTALELKVTGTLPTGGFDAQAQRYLGDLDTFAFNVTTPGNLSVSVTWAESADVDVLLVTDVVAASDTTANKPARLERALSGGTFGVIVASASGPASYTLTLRFDPLPAGGGASSSSSSGGTDPGTTLDAKCTWSSDYGLDKVYIFWPDHSYLLNFEFTNIGTWDRKEEGSYGIHGDSITLVPNAGDPHVFSFQQDNNVEVFIDGDLYLCFDRG